MFSMGCGSLSLIAYLLSSWRSLILFLSMIGVLYIPVLWFIPESPRWNYVHGHIEKSRLTLILFGGVHELKMNLVSSTTQKVDKLPRQGIIDIIQSKSTRKVCFILTYIFWAVSAVYYGLAYGAAKLPGSLYVNNLMNSTVECAGLLLMLSLMNVFGRRKLTSVTLFFGAFMLIMAGLCFIYQVEVYAVQPGRWISFIGMLAISTTFGIIWVYAAELYPTSVRTGICQFFFTNLLS